MSNETDASLQETTRVRLLARNISTILYQGSLPDSERKVAIKVWLLPPANPSQSQQAYARLRTEITTLQQLKHPHILQPLNMRRTAQGIVIVSNFAQHGSLHQLLQRQPHTALPLEQAIGIIQQIGSALDAAHQQSLVHGNLTPENVLFTHSKDSDGEDLVVLSDFYLPTLAAMQAHPRENDHPRLRLYMAPEAFQGMTSALSDQYALACLAYELLTGQTPFTGAARMTLYQKHSSEAVSAPSVFSPNLSGGTSIINKEGEDVGEQTHYDPPGGYCNGKLNPALSTRIDTALLKALAKQPGERFASVADFLTALGTGTATGAMAQISTTINKPLLLEAEAISQAADALIERDTAGMPVLVMPPTATAAAAPDAPTVEAPITTDPTTVIPPTPTTTPQVAAVKQRLSQAQHQQSKGTRPMLIAITVVLLLAVLGSAFFVFFANSSGSNPSNTSQTTTALQTTHTKQATATTALTATATAAHVQKQQPTATPTHVQIIPTAIPTAKPTPTAQPTTAPTPTATAVAQPATAGTVKPILECVQPQGGFYLAKFGYLNTGNTTVTIPQGPQNNANPSFYTSQLPTSFSPGRQYATFQIHVFKGMNLVWSLDGNTATASSSSPPC